MWATGHFRRRMLVEFTQMSERMQTFYPIFGLSIFYDVGQFAIYLKVDGNEKRGGFGKEIINEI